MKFRCAAFLDKDGTVVEDVPYNVDPARLRLTPRAVVGLKMLVDSGFVPIIVSNQSGIAKGLFSETSLLKVASALFAILARHQIQLAGCYFCPHHPEGTVSKYSLPCDCRKPNPGLLLSAANDLGIDLRSSWMIGDILDDVEAGNRAGCRTVLIDNGGETMWEMSEKRTPDFMATDLESAAKLILSQGPVAGVGGRAS